MVGFPYRLIPEVYVMKRFLLLALVPFIVTAFYSCSPGIESPGPDDIVVENREFRLVLGSDAIVRSLIHKPSGQECLVSGIEVPAFSLTQYRPYDNELQLAYPAKSKTFPANSVRRDGDSLVVEFDLIKNTATIGLKITDDYIGFTLDRLDYQLEDYGVKRVTPVDEVAFLQLPVKDRENFGEWLNVIWDENIAVNLLGTDPFAKIDGFPGRGYHLLSATAIDEVKSTGTGCALIATSRRNLLDRIRKVEEDFGLPDGVESRQRPEYKWSYYELRGNGKLLETIDKNLAYAKQGGFRAMVIYYPDFAREAGHFEWREEFPRGMADLQVITGKIKAAGLIPGIHLHYNKAGLRDPYVSPVPDHRLNLRRIFTLAAPLNSTSAVITVEENPAGCTMDDGRRYLKIGRELITYESYTAAPPYQFTGCIRGALDSTPGRYDTGCKFGILDVDTWPIFVRFDQRTSIQRETAARLGRLYKEAGFEFVYFDGAEDVHPPYWFHGANAQYELYKALDPKPLFSEGAMKAHFSWHIITRGNAFDVFPPEVIKEATRRYPLAEAPHISKDFTSLNFGWMDYVAPGENTIGTQPDMYEYISSHAAGWDCPVALVARMENMDVHPRTPDNLEVLKRWEDVRNSDFLTDERKKQLRDPNREHILLLDEQGRFELQECQQLTEAAGGNSGMRAFIFTRSGRVNVVYWHISGQAEAELKVDPDNVRLYRVIGETLPFQSAEGSVRLPVAGRLFLEFDLPREEVIGIMNSARLVSD